MTAPAAPAPLLPELDAVARDLAGRAEALERDGVTRADVAALAAAGLLAVHGPEELGGVDPATQRRAGETLAGASPDAWFVWFQHGPVVKLLSMSENTDLQERHLAALCRGEQLGAVAWSHLRTPRPSITATRVEGGWSLSGSQPWCTGWGLADVLLVGAVVAGSDEVVFGLVPAGDRPGLRSAGRLDLAAMSGTSTHALALDDLLLPDRDVVLRVPRGPWAARDAAMNANVQPSTFGTALAALELLEEREPGTAAVLRARLAPLREDAYRLLDEVPWDQAQRERLDLRARALLLAMECCTALLAARGGAGMDLSEPAQRLLRAAAFQLVHSSAGYVKAATLQALVA